MGVREGGEEREREEVKRANVGGGGREQSEL